MGDAWGGWKNGEIPAKAMQKVLGYYLRPDAAEAMRGAIAELGKSGIAVQINESYRPLGVPGDQYIRDEFKTSTKCSNQWFQWGRAQRGETSASYPGTSNHGWGTASDISNGGNAKLREVLLKYGWVFDVRGESWHTHFVGIPKPVPEPTASQKLYWSRMQKYLQTYWGYSGAIDGIAGEGTWIATQRWLKARWGYSAAIDGKPGPQTLAAMQRAGCHPK